MRSAISTPIREGQTSASAIRQGGMALDNAGPSPPPDDASELDVAAYLFDMLVGARRLAVSRRHRFLAYLIGMAVEEARLLTIGHSAAVSRRE